MCCNLLPFRAYEKQEVLSVLSLVMMVDLISCFFLGQDFERAFCSNFSALRGRLPYMYCNINGYMVEQMGW